MHDGKPMTNVAVVFFRLTEKLDEKSRKRGRRNI